MKITKTTYLHSFTFVVIILALVRCGIERDKYLPDYLTSDTASIDSTEMTMAEDTTGENFIPQEEQDQAPCQPSRVAMLKDDYTPHKIFSVSSFKTAFPDTNAVHLVPAMKYGVKIVKDREDAEKRKSELVYIASSPYYSVDNLRESIPYLVPRASVLLQDIGRAFYDSLFVKGIPFQQFIVTSALRTQEDVDNLRKHNRNASENSCHRYGTTFDICYNRYKAVQTKELPRREVRSDSLKWVLSEVLRDMRERGRCYVKYEVRQGCFHVTTR